MEQIYGVREKHLTFLNLSDTLTYIQTFVPGVELEILRVGYINILPNSG